MTNPPLPRPALPEMHLPEELRPTYANLVRIAHSPADLVLDFAHLMPGESRATIQARIVLSPISAKLLYRALAENLGRYEAAFGEIHLPGDSSLAEHLFRPYQPPEPPKEG